MGTPTIGQLEKTQNALDGGLQLFCMWAMERPAGFDPTHGAFIVTDPTDMRKLAADLFTMADGLDDLYRA